MSEQPGRFRRVYSSWWLQGATQRLSEGERLVALYCRTGPPSTSVGCYRLSTATAVEELGCVSADEFNRRLAAVCEAYGWQFDPVVRVLWIPEWIQENPVQSVNVVLGWRKLLGNVPDCAVKARAVEAIHAYLRGAPEPYRRAFGDYRVELRGELPVEPSVELRGEPSVERAEALRKNRSKSCSTQGAGDLSGIQGAGEQAAALRAVAETTKNGKGRSLKAIDQRLLRIARSVLEDCSGRHDENYAIDAFIYSATQEGFENLSRAQAAQALSMIVTPSDIRAAAKGMSA